MISPTCALTQQSGLMFDLPLHDAKNTDKCLTNVSEALLRDKNRKCRIALAKVLAVGGNMNRICKEETQTIKN